MRWTPILIAVLLLGACNSANNLPTQAVLPTALPTFTSTFTLEPTSSATESDASTATTTETATVIVTASLISPTDTPMPTSTLTDTPFLPSITPTPTETPMPTIEPTEAVEATNPETYYTTGGVNLRSCPSTSCDVAGQLAAGAGVTVDGWTNGEAVTSGNTVWYRVQYGGGVAYIYSTLVTDRGPAPTSPPVQQQVQQPPPAQPTQRQWNCSGDIYNCSASDFSSMSEMRDYFNSCPGDPSKLDGNNDGVPCESGLR